MQDVSPAIGLSAPAPKTRLTAAFLAHTGASDPLDLLAGLVRDRYDLDAGGAPMVFAEAVAGDPVAQGIIE